MKQIDHDPNEPKLDRSAFPWWIGWMMLGLGWAWYFNFKSFDWLSIMLGLGTGTMLACWAIETTGNNVPDSWRKKR